MNLEKASIKCGVKFCGGCNPGYDRGKAFLKIRELLPVSVVMEVAEEQSTYDALLLLGGCTSCCASFEEYKTKNGVIKMWKEEQIPYIVEKIKSNM